nr:MAG TPA: hypothetical protein [Caudoviricetes sp.]
MCPHLFSSRNFWCQYKDFGRLGKGRMLKSRARMVAGQGGNRLADSGQPGERRPRKNEPKGAQALLGGKSQKGTNGKPRI